MLAPLAQRMWVIAPDMAGFGFTERCRTCGDGHLVAQALGCWMRWAGAGTWWATPSARSRWRWRSATRSAMRRLVLMGSVGSFPITPGLDAGVGLHPSFGEHVPDHGLLRLGPQPEERRAAELRYRASIRQASVSPSRACFPRRASAGGCGRREDDIRASRTRPLIVHGRDDQVILLQTSGTLLRWIERANFTCSAAAGTGRRSSTRALRAPGRRLPCGEGGRRRARAGGRQGEGGTEGVARDGRAARAMAVTRRTTDGSSKPTRAGVRPAYQERSRQHGNDRRTSSGTAISLRVLDPRKASISTRTPSAWLKLAATARAARLQGLGRARAQQRTDPRGRERRRGLLRLQSCRRQGDARKLDADLQAFGLKTERIPAGEMLETGERVRFEVPSGHLIELYAEKTDIGNGQAYEPDPWIPDAENGIALPEPHGPLPAVRADIEKVQEILRRCSVSSSSSTS